MSAVKTLKAQVRNGRIVMDEPTDLPEGTVLHLVMDDGGDELTNRERALLHASLERSWAQARAGQTRPVEQLLAELKATHVDTSQVGTEVGTNHAPASRTLDNFETLDHLSLAAFPEPHPRQNDEPAHRRWVEFSSPAPCSRLDVATKK